MFQELGDEEEPDKKDLPTNGVTNPIYNNVKPENTDLNASGNSNISDNVFMQ